MSLDNLDREIELALEKARTQNPMFLVLSNFTQDVRELVENFWSDGFRNGVIATHLSMIQKDMDDSGLRH